jgi:hypothetical protein
MAAPIARDRPDIFERMTAGFRNGTNFPACRRAELPRQPPEDDPRSGPSGIGNELRDHRPVRPRPAAAPLGRRIAARVGPNFDRAATLAVRPWPTGLVRLEGMAGTTERGHQRRFSAEPPARDRSVLSKASGAHCCGGASRRRSRFAHRGLRTIAPSGKNNGEPAAIHSPGAATRPRAGALRSQSANRSCAEFSSAAPTAGSSARSATRSANSRRSSKPTATQCGAGSIREFCRGIASLVRRVDLGRLHRLCAPAPPPAFSSRGGISLSGACGMKHSSGFANGSRRTSTSAWPNFPPAGPPHLPSRNGRPIDVAGERRLGAPPFRTRSPLPRQRCSPQTRPRPARAISGRRPRRSKPREQACLPRSAQPRRPTGLYRRRRASQDWCSARLIMRADRGMILQPAGQQRAVADFGGGGGEERDPSGMHEAGYPRQAPPVTDLQINVSR